MKKSLLTLLLAVSALVGCKDRAAEEQAARAAAAQRAETAAAEQARQYEAARGAGQWELAKAYADVLQADYAGTQAAQRVAATAADTAARAKAAYETRRLVALWTYHAQPLAKGEQRSGFIYAKAPASPRVRLVLRKHPEWGQSVYLLIDAGEFDCPKGCSVGIAFDDGAVKKFAATKPKENLQALFVEDDKAFLKAMRQAKTVTIEAVSAGKPLQPTFEVAGYDPARL